MPSQYKAYNKYVTWCSTPSQYKTYRTKAATIKELSTSLLMLDNLTRLNKWSHRCIGDPPGIQSPVSQSPVLADGFRGLVLPPVHHQGRLFMETQKTGHAVNAEDTSEILGPSRAAHMGVSERLDTILN